MLQAQDDFSVRVLTHPMIATSQPLQNGNLLDLELPCYAAIKNQLLVAPTKNLDAVVTAVTKETGASPVLLTTLFEGLSPQYADPTRDVRVYEIEVPGGRDVFELADAVNASIGAPLVSPNHVMISAPAAWGCPHGAPRPSPDDDRLRVAPGDPSKPHVTVIDSGWQWAAAFGANPLYGTVLALPAHKLPTADQATEAKANGSTHGALWQSRPHEAAPALVNGTLAALAGHANFVAGIIATNAPGTQITVLSHDGAFISDADAHYALPTEATVARSLCEAMLGSRPPDVVDLGFAFEAAAPSPVWPAALWVLEATRALRHHKMIPVILAPAGNQDSSRPRYPAALDWVTGVGSTEPDLSGEPYSNYGPWVDCATGGTDVLSTFIPVDLPLEEKSANPSDFSANSMARWDGTSFATPQVAAMVCNAMSAHHVEPQAAWHGIVNAKIATGAAKDPNRGWILP